MPLISIITPTYNRTDLLKRAAHSVLGQTQKDLEWIIVDDGSTDGTDQMIAKIGDERIRYFKLPHTARLPRIRNFGIAQAKGEYIALLDSDDHWESNYLEVMMKEMAVHPDTGYILSESRILEGGGVPYPSIYQPQHKQKSPGSYWNELFTDPLFVIFPSAIIMRKAAFEKAGRFNEEMRFGEKDLFTKLAWHFNGAISPSVQVNINRHGNNASSKASLNSLAELSFKEELLTLQHFRENRYIPEDFYTRYSALFLFKLAEFYYRNGYFEEAAAAYRESNSKRRTFKGTVKSVLSRLRK